MLEHIVFLMLAWFSRPKGTFTSHVLCLLEIAFVSFAGGLIMTAWRVMVIVVVARTLFKKYKS